VARQLHVVDLYSGRGGASRASELAGDILIRVEIDPRFANVPSTIIQDVRYFHWPGELDLIVASPPCTEFAKWGFPSSWRGAQGRSNPDMSIVQACRAFAGEHPEALYVMENVRVAQRWLGPAVCHRGSRYLWGDVGLLPPMRRAYGKWRLPPSPMRAALRSEWPPALSWGVRNLAVMRTQDGPT
jgi:hypothetical protein